MSITALPLVSLLRDRLQWHQARQKVLAENIANADTPGFQPRDLKLPSAAPARSAGGSGGVVLDRTNPLHIATAASSPETGTRAAQKFETRPSGNALNLEDEMLKVAENQSEYQLAASLYQKSLAMLRSAAGVRGA